MNDKCSEGHERCKAPLDTCFRNYCSAHLRRHQSEEHFTCDTPAVEGKDPPICIKGGSSRDAASAVAVPSGADVSSSLEPRPPQQTKPETCIHDDDPSIKLLHIEEDGDLYLKCPACQEETYLRPLTQKEIDKQPQRTEPLKDLLKRLDEDGATGLDLSPGDYTAREAAKAIRSLLLKDRVERVPDENYLQFHARMVTYARGHKTELPSPNDIRRFIARLREYDEECQQLRAAFDIPGLTGVWRYHRRGDITTWCATYVDADGICDTEEFTGPWAALRQAKSEVERNNEEGTD